MSNQRSFVIRQRGSSLARANHQITIANKALAEIEGNRWDLEKLSWNNSLPWSESLIERYADRWDWGTLSYNESLPWSKSLIERFADRWGWDELSENESLPWTLSLVEFFDKNGYCPHSSLLGELTQNLYRKVLVQIMDAIDQASHEKVSDKLNAHYTV